jgi:hypothetical protein
VIEDYMRSVSVVLEKEVMGHTWAMLQADGFWITYGKIDGDYR